MGHTQDRLVSLAGRVADVAVHTTSTIVAKGKEKVDRYTLEKRLHRAQRQLGVLVYTLAKTGESNKTLVARYVEEIDRIHAELTAEEPDARDPLAVHTCSSCCAGVAKDAMFCGSCGQKLSSK